MKQTWRGRVNSGIGRLATLGALLWLTVAAAVPLAANDLDRKILHGKVVGVADGDTVTVLDENHLQHKIRLNGIDAPESAQAFGQTAKRNLSALVFGQDVVVTWDKIDRYGRLVGTVMRGETNANLEQLRAGLAWYYREYASDVPGEFRSAYAAAEAEARAAKRGLWQDATPQAPWVYRHPQAATPSEATRESYDGPVVGNRNSHLYHLPGCVNYSTIAERNRVNFDSEDAAQRAGYRRAGNCRS